MTIGEIISWWKNFKAAFGFESTAPRIVQFEDGKYAIRKGSRLTGYEFLDLQMTQSRWRTRGAAWYCDCMSASLDEVKNRFNRVCPKQSADHGKPV